MKKHFIKGILFMILVSILFLCACRQEPNPPAERITITSEIDVMLKSGSMEIQNTYKTDYFRGDACLFDKDLALLSFALAALTSRNNAIDTLNAMSFDNLRQNWNDEGKINGCSYVIGHRTVDNYELVAVYVNGTGYNVEWAGNFTLGETGNHEGFDIAAKEVYEALKEYVAMYYPKKNIKFWITGYSRAAAIADVVAYNIIEEKDLNTRQSDLYVYAFEAPASIAKDKAKAYQCIHNIMAETDVIPAIPPLAYGLSRPGVELKMASDPDTVNARLHEYVDQGIAMPTFTAGDDYNNPSEFLTYFIDGILSKSSNPTAASFESREKYYSSIQVRIVYLTEVLEKNNSAGLRALIKYIEDNRASLFSIFMRWISEDGFYSDLKEILTSCHTEYADSELKNACSILPSLYLNENLDAFLIGFVADTDKRNNVMYITCCHYPEVCYALLKGYQEN